MKINERYAELLQQNADYHKKVKKGTGSYTSKEYLWLKQELLEFELKMSSAEIIFHAETLFPEVTPQ